MRNRIAAFLCSTVVYACLTGNAFAVKQPGMVITPGVGVGTIALGSRYSQQTLPQDMRIEQAADGRITKIRIKGAQYAVQYNQLRVGYGSQEIFRYYENLEKSDAGPDRILLRSPGEGIEFIINRTREVIEEIGVFEAVIPNAYKQQVPPQKTKKPADGQDQRKSFYIDQFK